MMALLCAGLLHRTVGAPVLRRLSTLVPAAARPRRHEDAVASTAHAAEIDRQLPAAGLAFDLETTGLDVESSEIVQIAIVVANSQRGALWHSLVLPEGPIDPGAAAVHGLTREALLEREARPFAEVWAECEEWLEQTLGTERPLIWAAHNGDRFDRPILSRCVLAARGGTELPLVLQAPRASFVDTITMAKRARAGRPDPIRGYTSHRLGCLYHEASGGPLDGAHDALADSRALAAVWRWLVETKAADPRAGSGAGAFQAHLQATAYLPAVDYALDYAAPAPRAAQPQRSFSTDGLAASLPVLNSLSALAVVAEDDVAVARAAAVDPAAGGEGLFGAPLTDVSGVGPFLCKKLHKVGIETMEDLHTLYEDCGRDDNRLTRWLCKNVKGIQGFVAAKAARGVAARFGKCDASD
jgi:DNA polymerase III epsilon subunit-like protein